MRRPRIRPTFWVVLCCAALLTLASATLTAAPAPFTHPTKKAEQLRHTNLVGAWKLHWHGATGNALLSADGCYRCQWCGMEFVGTWKLSEGCIVITESYRPDDSHSWHTFSVSLTPDSSQDRPTIRLERVR